MIKIAATGDFDTALAITNEYLAQVGQERANAEEAIRIVRFILADRAAESSHFFKRKEASEYLDISMDTFKPDADIIAVWFSDYLEPTAQGKAQQ